MRGLKGTVPFSLTRKSGQSLKYSPKISTDKPPAKQSYQKDLHNEESKRLILSGKAMCQILNNPPNGENN
jgi:hypothetical protein